MHALYNWEERRCDLKVTKSQKKDIIYQNERIEWEGLSFNGKFQYRSTIDFALLSMQVITMTSNPFAWDTSANDVNSAILSVHLKNGSHSLKISNLSRDIQLNIDTRSKPVKQRTSFAKPSTTEKMRRHVVNITSNHMTLQIRLKPENGRSLRVYLRHGYPPTEELYDFQATIPDHCGAKLKRTDHPSEHGDTSTLMNCEDPNLISISSNVTGHLGIHYVGIVAVEKGKDSNVRTRRSCIENGRHKRSTDCLHVKDPPTPTPRVIKPLYDPVTDVKYNLSVTIATCLYLSESGKWTTEGCKVLRLYFIHQSIH